MAARSGGTWVGLEPAADALRAVAMVDGVIAAAVEVPLSGTSTLAAQECFVRVAESLQRQGVTGRPRCVSMPPEASIVSAVLELPPRSSGAPVEMLAAAEIVRGRAAGAVEVGAFDLPISKRNGASGSEYLVVGGDRESILGLLSAGERAGLMTEAIDTPATSAARALGTGARMVVEVCTGSMRLHVCVDETPRFSYVSHYPRGEHVASRLIEEIDRCAAYAASRFPDTPLQRVLLAGPVARDHAIAEATRREFDAPVEVWRASGWPVARAATGVIEDPAFAQACALATWGHRIKISEPSATISTPVEHAALGESSAEIKRSAAA